MTDATESENTETSAHLSENTEEPEVQAHTAAPLSLQELGVKSPEEKDGVIGMSINSMLICV